MRKYRKELAVLLCLVVFAAMALGSGSSKSSDKKEIVSAEEGDTAKEADASAEDAAADTTADDTQADGEKTAADSSEVTINEQELVNQNDIIITAQEYVKDDIWGDGIKVLIENNSAQDVTVGCNALIVNDYMIMDLFSADVAAGKKANEVIYLSSTELNAAGIDTVGKVEIYFNIYDPNTYETIFAPDCVTIETSQIANMDTTPNDEGKELYNNGGIRIVGKSVDENSFWGTAILLYCENTTGRNIGISVDNLSVNGYMLTPYFATTIYDGKKCIDDITLMSSDLETNGITSIDTVELKFHIYDEDTYDTIADTEAITFAAK